MGNVPSICRRSPTAVDVALNITPGVLFEAVEIGDLESVRQFLRLGVDICTENQFGQTPLHAACLFGQKEVAEFLLSQGADLEVVDKNMLTPFIYAAVEGHQEIMEMLLDCGAIANTTGKGGLTPLHFAVRYSPVALEAAQALVQCGADPCARSQHGEIPLHSACFNYEGSRVISYLLDLKSTVVNATTLSGTTPLHIASANAAKSSVTILLRRGADIEIRNKGGATALHFAVGSLHSGRCQVVEELLLHCPNNSWVNTPDSSGRTPLHAAAAHGQYSVVELLLAKNADLHVLDKEGRTILHAACASGTPGRRMIVEEMLDRGLSADALDASGLSALHHAAKAGNLGCVEELLRQGCQTAVRGGPTSASPLHVAAQRDRAEVCEMLANADPGLLEMRDAQGRTALHCAAECGSPQATAVLLDLGMSAATVDNAKQTPLHLAAAVGNVEVTACLVDFSLGRPVMLSVLDGNGLAAIHIAAQKGFLSIVEALMAAGCRPDTPTANGSSAVALAEESGHGEVVELLQRGVTSSQRLVAAGPSGSVSTPPATHLRGQGDADMASSLVSSHASYASTLEPEWAGGSQESLRATLGGPSHLRRAVQLPPVQLHGARHSAAGAMITPVHGGLGPVMVHAPSRSAFNLGTNSAAGVSDENANFEEQSGFPPRHRSEAYAKTKLLGSPAQGGARDRIMRALSWNVRPRKPTPAEVLKQLHARTRSRRASLFSGDSAANGYPAGLDPAAAGGGRRWQGTQNAEELLPSRARKVIDDLAATELART